MSPQDWQNFCLAQVMVGLLAREWEQARAAGPDAFDAASHRVMVLRVVSCLGFVALLGSEVE